MYVQMEINKAILEENEASEEGEGDGREYVVIDDGEEVVQPTVEKEQVFVTATGTRTRNRPKREVY
jgi:hypothetical protein